MVLNTHPIYPSAGRYVLRLHRDARPENGHLSGSIEHVSSGDSIDFATGAELLAWLARHAAETRERANEFQPSPQGTPYDDHDEPSCSLLPFSCPPSRPRWR